MAMTVTERVIQALVDVLRDDELKTSIEAIVEALGAYPCEWSEDREGRIISGHMCDVVVPAEVSNAAVRYCPYCGRTIRRVPWQ